MAGTARNVFAIHKFISSQKNSSSPLAVTLILSPGLNSPASSFVASGWCS